jgi:hypothetical protein
MEHVSDVLANVQGGIPAQSFTKTVTFVSAMRTKLLSSD